MNSQTPDCLRAIKQLRQDNLPRPLTWMDRATTGAYLLIIFACFALAGTIDREEDERTTLERYVWEHANIVSAADDLPGTEKLADAKMIALPLVMECR